MSNGEKKVAFFGLSTCGWCRRTKEWLDEHNVKYELYYVDQTTGDELESLKAEMKKYAERQSFPLVVINDGEKVIQGYQVKEFEEAFG